MDIFSILQNFNIVLVSKIFFLILLGIYIIFILMLANKIRSFDKIVVLSGKVSSAFVKSFAFFYLILLLFLFVAGLVIV